MAGTDPSLGRAPPASLQRTAMETQARPPQVLRLLLSRFLAVICNHSTHVSATAQLRPLDKFDTSQIQNAFSSYGKCRIVELEKPSGPLITPVGQTSCGSTPIVVIAATALAVLAELSDTKTSLSDTNHLPLPYGVCNFPSHSHGKKKPQALASPKPPRSRNPAPGINSWLLPRNAELTCLLVV